MEETILSGDGKIFAHEIVGSKSSLEIILEGGAQIRVADAGGSGPSSPIHKWHPAGMGAKIVAQQNGSADHIGDVGIELGALEDFTKHFPVAAIPVVPGYQLAENPAKVKICHGKVMLGFAEKDFVPQTCAQRHACLESACMEAVANV